MDIRLDANNDIWVVAQHFKKNSGLKGNTLDGYALVKIDRKTKKVVLDTVAYLPESELALLDQKELADATTLYLQFMDNGNLIVVSESIDVASQTTGRPSSGTNTSSYYTYGNTYISSIDPGGKVVWFRVAPKLQGGTNRAFFSTLFHSDGKNAFLLFNDQPENESKRDGLAKYKHHDQSSAIYLIKLDEKGTLTKQRANIPSESSKPSYLRMNKSPVALGNGSFLFQTLQKEDDNPTYSNKFVYVNY
jgi:hypothetical protein